MPISDDIQKWIALIASVITIILLYPLFRKVIRSKRNQFLREKTVEGLLLPLSAKADDDILIRFGHINVAYKLSRLQYADFSSNDLFRCEDEKVNPLSLKLKWEKGRIYVSIDIRYLLNEEIIGKIEFNRWRLYKDNYIDFNPSKRKIEVFDKQGSRVFQMEFVPPNVIWIRGYFIGERHVLVVYDKGLVLYPKDEPTWRDLVREASKPGYHPGQ